MFNLKLNNMSTSSKSSIKPLYAASQLTKNSSKNLWVVFPAGKPAKGLVFSSVLNRDTVRSVGAKALGIDREDTRSRRVSNLNARKIRNSK